MYLTNKDRFIKIFTELIFYLEKTNQSMLLGTTQTKLYTMPVPLIELVKVTKNEFRFYAYNKFKNA